ncbi:MAG: alpha/beta hydrolase-fold protein [Acidobacteria bacterium]|nr:alpha/beta hydrolase-fold protein [Acidobacteriota bacterium]
MRALLFLLPFALLAQGPPARIVSPEVHPDRRVTLRFRAPNAAKVTLNREGGRPADMVKDDKGIWSITTEALAPDMYGYSFNADGVSLIDPGNPSMKPNLLSTTSMFHVPSADASLPWETRDVPRGTVHHHFFRSAICQDQRDFFVYTPPGYDPKAKTKYPVLYLLHGFSDDASGWTSVGQAHVILDNLIAQGKAKPMLVVMTLGYGTMEVLQNRTMGKKSFDLFGESLLKEVIPTVEKTYRASTNRAQRALAGLSMGGAETLVVGLNHLETFSQLGAFSSGGVPADFPQTFPNLTAKANDQLKLLWIACGKDDRLIDANNKFVAFLKERNVKHEYVVTEGAHTWLVWRRSLSTLAPQLFR